MELFRIFLGEVTLTLPGVIGLEKLSEVTVEAGWRQKAQATDLAKGKTVEKKLGATLRPSVITLTKSIRVGLYFLLTVKMFFLSFYLSAFLFFNSFFSFFFFNSMRKEKK